MRPARAERFEQLLVIGIGGSALGPQFVATALGEPGSGLALRFLDNADPDGIDRTLGRIDLATTLTCVISKSGGTPETRNGMLETAAAYEAGGLELGPHAVAITQEGSKLDRFATEQGFLERLPMWDWVGGRTSELSAVGLLPAALGGIDVEALCEGAAAMDRATRGSAVDSNPKRQSQYLNDDLIGGQSFRPHSAHVRREHEKATNIQQVVQTYRCAEPQQFADVTGAKPPVTMGLEPCPVRTRQRHRTDYPRRQQVGDEGSPCRALHTQCRERTVSKDEKVVDNDVDQVGKDGDLHRCPCVADAAEEVGIIVVNDEKRPAQHADIRVGKTQRPHGRIRSQNVDGPRVELANQQDEGARDKCQVETLPQVARAVVIIPRAETL